MRRLMTILLLAVALASIFPEARQGSRSAHLNLAQRVSADAVHVGASGKTPAFSAWLPVVMRSSRVLPPMPTPTPGLTRTPINGLTVRGHVRLGDSTGPGLAGVAIHLFFSSYYPGDVVATTGADGDYETAFIYIPGDEMVTVWPELSGYAFDPPHHYWRHYAGIESAVRDFVAHALTPTATATQAPTASPTATGTATATPTATPTQTTVPAPGDLYISALQYSGSDEYVEITNRGGSAQVMTGWRIQSVRGDQWYSFPGGYILAPGAYVRVHSGAGAIDNPPTDLKWTGAYIWNNEGDEARLYDAQGGLVDSWAY